MFIVRINKDGVKTTTLVDGGVIAKEICIYLARKGILAMKIRSVL